VLPLFLLTSKLAKYLGHDQIETLSNHAGRSSIDQGGGKRRGGIKPCGNSSGSLAIFAEARVGPGH